MAINPKEEPSECAHVDYAQSIRFTRLEGKSRIFVETHSACHWGRIAPWDRCQVGTILGEIYKGRVWESTK
jgi:hypothetical protein